MSKPGIMPLILPKVNLVTCGSRSANTPTKRGVGSCTYRPRRKSTPNLGEWEPVPSSTTRAQRQTVTLLPQGTQSAGCPREGPSRTPPTPGRVLLGRLRNVPVARTEQSAILRAQVHQRKLRQRRHPSRSPFVSRADRCLGVYTDRVGNPAVSLRQAIRKPFKTPFLNPHAAKSTVRSDVSSAAVPMRPPPVPAHPLRSDALEVAGEDEDEIQFMSRPSPPPMAVDKGKGKAKAKAPTGAAIHLSAESSDTISQPGSEMGSEDLAGQRACKQCCPFARFSLTVFPFVQPHQSQFPIQTSSSMLHTPRRFR